MAPRIVEVREDGMTVDLLCWQLLGRTAEVTEAVLRANPGLAELGPILPLGTNVEIPEALERGTGQRVRKVVHLWD